MKGIILAGGSGSRLHPITKGVSKQLLPVYDKPMIYYPLSTLMLAGIRDILVITTPYDQPAFMRLLGDGSAFGINLSYAVQPEPRGLAEAFIIGREFIGTDSVCLVLGDNIFYGHGFPAMMRDALKCVEAQRRAVVFGHYVQDPERYGVATLNEQEQIIGIEEKPRNPQSHYAVVGLYFYPNEVIDIAASVAPSARGELEITSVNQAFLEQKKLDIKLFGRGFAWLDTGTFESLAEASIFVEVLEKRQGLKVSCPEEIAFRSGWLSADQLRVSAEAMRHNSYGRYLSSLLP